MSLLHPFRAWRPRPGLESRVAAPPYDVINSDEARTMATGIPESFLHVSKAEIDLEPGTPPHDERVYATARNRFQWMCDTGLLLRDDRPAYYLYRLTMNGREQTGVAALASVDAYLEERIKKHEFTRPDKENDRTRLAETLKAHSGPVFLTHRHDPRLAALSGEIVAAHAPVCDFKADDGVRHTLWVVDDPETIRAMTHTFAAMPALYIADGHHRAAAAARVCRALREKGHPLNDEAPFDRFLAVAFPETQVKILDYNRVVRDLNGHDVGTFLNRIGTLFQVLPMDGPVTPSRRHEFGMYLSGRWFRLRGELSLEEENDPVRSLDVTLLQERLLAPVLGIRDPRQDTRIDFVGGIRGLDELRRRVDSGEMAVAFCLFPTGLEELMSVADSGQVMPPKSTWFEPKLRDGLVVQTFR